MRSIIRISGLIFLLNCFTFVSHAQLRKIPATVTSAFKSQYPDADSVEWKDRITGYSASFIKDEVSHTAYYDNNGNWESTDILIDFDDLPEVIADSHSKTKYADWEVGAVHKIELPDDVLNYRIQVIKSDIQKKNLYFNEKGRLLKEKISL